MVTRSSKARPKNYKPQFNIGGSRLCVLQGKTWIQRLTRLDN